MPGYPWSQALRGVAPTVRSKERRDSKRNTARAGWSPIARCLGSDQAALEAIKLGKYRWETRESSAQPGPAGGRLPIRRLRRHDPGAYGVNVRAALRGSARKSPKRRTGDTARGRRVRPTLSPVSARGPGLPHGRDRRDIDPFYARRRQRQYISTACSCVLWYGINDLRP